MTDSTKNAAPEVSAVIPFYRNVGWLCEAVESVLAQDLGDVEIIVVNDGSPEDVSELLDRFGGRIRYFEKENGGAASARNAGLEQARGKYIAFLDSDALWTPEKLSVQLKKMKDCGARWSLTDYEVFGEGMKNEYKSAASGGERMLGEVPPYIATPTIVVERGLLEENALRFPDDLKYGQDIVLWELLCSKALALYIPEMLARVRIRGTNAGRRAAVQIHTRVEMYDKCAELIEGFKKSRSGLFRFAVALCRFGRRFVRKNSMGKANEFVARVLFAPPYLLFKLDRKRKHA